MQSCTFLSNMSCFLSRENCLSGLFDLDKYRMRQAWEVLVPENPVHQGRPGREGCKESVFCESGDI